MLTAQQLCEMVDPFGKIMLRYLLGADVSRLLDLYREKGCTITTGSTESTKSRPSLRYMDISKNGWHLRLIQQNPMKKSAYAAMARSGSVLCWGILTHPEKCPMPYWICYITNPKDEIPAAKRLKPLEADLGPLFKTKPNLKPNFGPLFEGKSD